MVVSLGASSPTFSVELFYLLVVLHGKNVLATALANGSSDPFPYPELLVGGGEVATQGIHGSLR